jgi:tRNA uridine 5-carbamoylmethylation protein Kti12
MGKVINLLGGPCSGKSTLAAELFSHLKKQNYNVELINEEAKELSWEERWTALACQPYIFGKQLLKIKRVIDKVDYVISDSPLLLSTIYVTEDYPESFKKSCIDIYKQMSSHHFLLSRTSSAFEETGRHHNEKESIKIDVKIYRALCNNDIGFWTLDRDVAMSIILRVLSGELVLTRKRSKN